MDGQVSAPGHVHADSLVAKPFIAKGHGHVPDGAFVVPDPNLIFNGEFKRAGLDLVLSHEGQELVVHDYFRGEKRAAIASPDGAHLTGDIVNALTGHVQVAQAAPGAAAAQVIGHVTKLSGSATAIRNGVSVILNNGDNVEKGDVVSTGADSTLGITFIDGTVFGLSSNARMVLNEMVYDPNGSSNSSLLSLVAGTITFVAGETAKHGDMKVDTPVATMGIRGTAVLTQINFVVPAGGGDPQPQASFQVLVEPNGTTGSYILFDKITLLPIATVNQAGQMIQISGGNVSIGNALMSPEIQKLITDVFTLKFTDNNTNTKLTTNFTDTITPISLDFAFKSGSGAVAVATFVNLSPQGRDGPSNSTQQATRVPGQPIVQSFDAGGIVKTAFALTERAGITGDTHADTITGLIRFVDQNLGDRPTVSVSLAEAPNYVYKSAGQQDVTGSLTELQKQGIAATQIQISVVADPANENNGSAVWTYTIPDKIFDFLAAGETLTLTYMVRVDTNFVVNPESRFIPITITITGTNDKPVVTTSVPIITFEGGTSVPGGPLTSDVPTSGTLNFSDVDLTDKHTVSVALTSATLPDGTVPPGPLAAFQSAMSVAIAAGADSTGDGTGTINWSLADLPVYLADFIPKGEVLTLVYTVTLTDSQGATSQQTITVTITGTDAPAVVWIATEGPGAPSGGFWKDAANWATGTVPTIHDDVIVITDQLHGLTPSYPVTIDTAAYANSLTLDDYDTTPGHETPEVINNSTLTIGGKLTLNADAKFTNSLGGHVTVGGAIDVETITRTSGVVVTNTSTITNAGTLTLAAGGTIDTLTAIANSGIIDLSGGTLLLKSDVTNACGTIQVDAGATLIVDGATVDGGTVAILGTLELDGTSPIENGTLNNSGTVNVNGTVEFANEAVSNAAGGTIKVLANGWLTIDQGSSVANAGHVTVDASGKLSISDATISGGTVTIAGALVSTGTSAVHSADINNTGTVSVTSGTLTIDPGLLHAITNQGLIEAVAGGTLRLTTATIANAGGTIVVDGASKLHLTDVTINGGSLTNAGNLYSVSGSNTITGAVTNTGTIEVQAGTLNLSGGITGVGTLIVDHDATLEFSGAIGSIHIVNSGSILGSGGNAAIHIEQATGSVVDNDGIIGPAVADLTSTTDAIVTIDGSITINNTAEINGNISVASAIFYNQACGIWTVAGTSVFGNVSSIVNAGEIDLLNGASISVTGLGITNSNEIDSWGTASITGTITNNHSIEVHTGTLTLVGTLSGSGSVTVDAGATLKLEDAVSQTITLAGDGARLQIDTSTFGGSIAGLSATDQIDLSTIAYGDGTSAVYVPNSNPATGGVLMVTDANGHSIQLTLVGADYSNAHFAGSSDGHGGTLITFNAVDDAPAFTAAEAAPSVAFAELPDTTGSSALDPVSGGSGTIHFKDVDLTDRPTATVSGQDVTGLAADGETPLTLTQDQIDALEHALSLQQAGNKNNGAVGWSYSIADQALDFLGEGETVKVVSTITLDDGQLGTDTAVVTVTITGANDAPVINVDQLNVTQNGGVVTVHGLSVADPDTNDTFTIAATAASGASVNPSEGSGSLAAINSALQAVTYTELGENAPATGQIAVTVTDSHNATDTVNLIFNLTEQGTVSLAGTTGKDVFFGTGYQDQFVFAADSDHDTILDFEHGQDHINLTAVVATDIDSAWIAQHVVASGADTLITINATDTILLKGVAQVQASDFIVHA